MRGNSLTGNRWWFLPPVAALFYPLAVRALYESGKLLRREGGHGGTVAWLGEGTGPQFHREARGKPRPRRELSTEHSDEPFSVNVPSSCSADRRGH